MENMNQYYKGIPITELSYPFKDIQVIDIRRKVEKRAFPIEGVKEITMGELLSDPKKYLKKEEEYYLICRSGRRTKQMTYYMRKLGYDVINIEGGIKEIIPEIE